MADQVAIQLPKNNVLEETNLVVTAYFRTRSTKAASTPTTVHYSVEDLSTRQTVRDWTSVSAASNVSITLDKTDTAIKEPSSKSERRSLLVMADRGLSTQSVGQANFVVENLRGI